MRLVFFKNFKISPISFGPFNAFDQRRWGKPANTAQTRLENRTLDNKLDKLTSHFRKLNIALHMFDLMSQRSRPYVSVQIMSRWANILGLNVKVSDFVSRYPRLFEVFQHPVRRNMCCTVTSKMRDLIEEEKRVMWERERDNVQVLKKIFMMSKQGTLHLHALRLAKREFGLPGDFRDSILRKYSEEFRLVDAEIVGLVQRDESLAIAEVESWRKKEFTEKWLSEFEVKYAFPINFPTGFKIESGFKGKLTKWQRMPYVTPYGKEGIRKQTEAGIKRFEKRVVGIVHELLSLTVEKVMPVERFVHFRKDLGIQVNMRELLLKHPGIFYISTKGKIQNVYLREAYSNGCLIEPNEVYAVRRKMLDLMMLRCRDSKELKEDKVRDEEKVREEEKAIPVSDKVVEIRGDGAWVIPFLERSND